jgi:N-acetylglucosaminyldiphosphoundecaprenol N-acetyl-beta-D-mannosaminyltransferase
LSLEWLYRLLQDPKRLFKRYLVTNTRYLWLIHRK